MSGLSASQLALLVLVIILTGGGAAFLLNRYNKSDRRITASEFAVCLAVALMVFLPSVGWATGAIAHSKSVGGYKEFWNGVIIAAQSQEFTCERDGDCRHTYDCDPYVVIDTTRTKQVSYTDSKGRTQYRTEPDPQPVTKFHQCPYATHEYSYWLTDSTGGMVRSADHIFAADVQQWRRGERIPGNVAKGVPAAWQTAKASLEAGEAPPMTSVHDYTNYLLASQDSILSAWSDNIDEYREAGLLPYHTNDLLSDPVKNGYFAEKVVFAGIDKSAVGNYDEWQQALARLNSQLGTERQGDLHVLVVPAGRIDNPDDYTTALLAYWQSRQLGKFGLAKNAIMMVVGVSDDLKTVKWSRAKTGIPEGNGALLSALGSRLKDKPFEPKTLIGWPTARSVNGKTVFTSSSGVVEQTILRDYPFQRPCMDCKDKDDRGSGYVYLESSAFIPKSAQYAILGVVFVLTAGMFALAAFLDFGSIARSAWSKTKGLRGRAGL